MRKSEDVATRMQQNSNYTTLFPSVEGEPISMSGACEPFSDDVISFLNDLASRILKDRESRLYPDVVTFAFFCRKANLLKLKELHMPRGTRLGRGTVFHIAPGNVPINFGYSMVTGLLAGNSNIVKLSSKPFPQVDIVLRHLHALTDNPVSRRILLVKFGHQSDAASFFSSMADVRVIWGGDHTISEIRKNALPPRSFDICFADRYSLCAIKASSIPILNEARLNQLAENFYNDTFLFDQNACSAPHLMVWVGNKEEIAVAKRIFWRSFHRYAKSKYELQAVIAVDKLNALYHLAIEQKATRESTEDNLIVRAQIPALNPGIEDFRCAGGFFTEYDASSIDEISHIINRKFQTLAYHGFSTDELTRFITWAKPCGIDRIVPIGDTTAFSLVWDGYDLINMLSRRISIH